GPMKLRLPLSLTDRLTVQAPKVADGARAGWPPDSMSIRGVWPTPTLPLQVRPIFPGSMRFLADDPVTVPTAEQLDVQNGKVTAACLARLSEISGTLLIRVQNSNAQADLRKIGTLEALGEAPTHAYYGSVRLPVAFFQNALLNHKTGLVPASVKATPD